MAQNERGNISVKADNIFPIIKKWLYSDKDIFIREMISNASDAITKLNSLKSFGEVTLQDDDAPLITITLDKDRRTLVFEDNGIGMTDDEVKKYINEVAFSGAEEFLSKYSSKEESGQIIGHFGLGFYSAFMVADQVKIETKSYIEDAQAVTWFCDGSVEYQMSASEKQTRGTAITLYLNAAEDEFLELERTRSVLEKYCAFLPYPIVVKQGEEEFEINDTQPLWKKAPAQCTAEEYTAFYHKVFSDFKDPLFYLHLNVDFPFQLQGILYFPQWDNEYDRLEGRIKLYNNQVFVADNVKEVIPEYLMLLRGVLDCPEIPLNVSRSFLQNDGYVKRISEHIVRKVCDKLTGIFKTDRDEYEGYWQDIRPFMQYGCLRDDAFYTRMKDCMLLKTTQGGFYTLEEYAQRNAKEQDKTTVYYTSDASAQALYAALYENEGQDVVIMDSPIDSSYMQFVEMKQPELQFMRVDAEIGQSMKEGESELPEGLTQAFATALPQYQIVIVAEKLKDATVPAVLLSNEHERRMQQYMKQYGNMFGNMGAGEQSATLVLNLNNPFVQKLPDLLKNAPETADLAIAHLYDLACMSMQPLTPERMQAFLKRSYSLLGDLNG